MVTALLAGLALAGPADFSLETRYSSAFGPDSWGSAHVRAEAAPDLELGAFLLGGTRSAAMASVRRSFTLADRAELAGELLFGMRRTAADQPGGPALGGTSALQITAVDGVAVALSGGGIAGVGGWFEGGVDASLSDRVTLHPRLRAGTWAGDRDLGLRVELGATHRWATGWFLRASAGAGGRDTVHLGPSATLALGRSS